jgi:hypothetical protein
MQKGGRGVSDLSDALAQGIGAPRELTGHASDYFFQVNFHTPIRR